MAKKKSKKSKVVDPQNLEMLQQMCLFDDTFATEVFDAYHDAAPNLREKPSNGMNAGDGDMAVKISNDDLQKLHEKRMRRVLEIAAKKGNDVVILGAFGCGAFGNPPEVVARAMKTVVDEYRNAFETIEFAVYCPPRDDSNYRTFKEILG